jgi:plastocyanin
MEQEQQQQESVIDLLFNILEQLLLPNWSDLIALLPWVLIVLVAVWLVFTAWQWRRAAEINRPRVMRPLPGTPPPGVHLPGPSRWPFVVPIGAALLLFSFALPQRDASGTTTLPFNLALLVAGLIVSAIGVTGWLLEAMREWRRTARAEGTPARAVAIESALVPARATAGAVAPTPEPAEPTLDMPVGVHLPGPSPWPFFAPIALAVILFGLVFSAVLIIGGLILGVIAVIGWYLDAGREYFSTETQGHAVPRTLDPERVWPRRLVPVFAAVIVISVLITIAPLGLGWLNSLTPAEATPTPVAVPQVPEISASNAISFETKLLVVPAGRPFELVFNNNDPGIPHNVEIADSPARSTVYLDGEVINGIASITYQVPALTEGDYYFLCRIHPNMNGTLRALPETGSAPAASPTP